MKVILSKLIVFVSNHGVFLLGFILVGLSTFFIGMLMKELNHSTYSPATIANAIMGGFSVFSLTILVVFKKKNE